MRPGLGILIACGASKQADISRQVLIQPQAWVGFQRPPGRRANARCARRPVVSR